MLSLNCDLYRSVVSYNIIKSWLLISHSFRKWHFSRCLPRLSLLASSSIYIKFTQSNTKFKTDLYSIYLCIMIEL